jgi:hypothetical protein
MPRKNKKEYNAYMRDYLPDYRKKQSMMLKEYKKMFGIGDGRIKKRGNKQ